MQEIVTLACEKWAAGDKVSVGLLLFANIEILELQALVKILQKYFYFKPKATEALFKEFPPFDLIPQHVLVLPQLLTLSSSMTETKVKQKYFSCIQPPNARDNEKCANQIASNLSKKFGPGWNAVVGEAFSFEISYTKYDKCF